MATAQVASAQSAAQALAWFFQQRWEGSEQTEVAQG